MLAPHRQRDHDLAPGSLSIGEPGVQYPYCNTETGRAVAYAQGTAVPADRSRAEIEKMMQRFGADQFMSGWERDNLALIGFRVHSRMVRIVLPMPDRADPLITLTTAGRRRTATQQEDAYNAEERRRWRSLVLVIKAKLTAVEDGISTIEREFLADVVLPDGTTLGAWAGPQIEKAYTTATMPALMPGGSKP